MSGGSFNYSSSARDLAMLMERFDDLRELATFLREHAQGSKASANTDSLLTGIKLIDELVQQKTDKLGPVWHALEWWTSCDYSKDQFLAEVEIYEQNN